MTARHTVLVVDDEPFVRQSLQDMLEGEGLRVVVAPDPKAAHKLLQSEPVDAIVADLQMPQGGGMALLDEVTAQGSGLPVIVITGVGTIASAVAAMKKGAFDFLQKPVDPGQLLLQVQRALEHRRLLADLSFLRRAADDRGAPERLVGDSPAMQKLRETVGQVARSDATVLITGESGTGKELVADLIHRSGPRAARNLVRVNCAAVPEALFESEFFGHRKGAFPGATSQRAGRFAEAEGGTLVLDEIGTLRPEMQAKLLQVLEGGEFQVVGEARTRRSDARVIAVSNEPLTARVQAGSFRPDLFYRLSIVPIEVPALRQHKEDLPAIARHLMERLVATRAAGAMETAEAAGARPAAAAAPATAALALAATASLSPPVIELLASYDWPGNVRELRNLLERALILGGGRPPDERLYRSLLESSMPDSGPVAGAGGGGKGDLHLRTRLDATEKEIVLAALARSEGKKKDAAHMLGIDPRNLGYYLRKHDIKDR
jgi:two-component system response regulator AtoC